MSEWDVIQSDQFVRDWKKILKRYPREAKQMLANLGEYRDSLMQHGNPLRLVEYSFVHRETSGCHAITQQPLPSAAQTRLYVYCYIAGRELHLICVGDKTSQAKDNRYCAQYVKNLNR